MLGHLLAPDPCNLYHLSLIHTAAFKEAGVIKIKTAL